MSEQRTSKKHDKKTATGTLHCIAKFANISKTFCSARMSFVQLSNIFGGWQDRVDAFGTPWTRCKRSNT